MKKLFSAISGLFALIPGFAVMFKGLATPQDYNYLFGGLIEAFGSLALLLLWMNRTKIKNIEPKKIIKTSIILAIGGFFSIFIYYSLFSFCVFGNNTKVPIVIPIWTSGKLNEVIVDAGGRQQAVLEHQTGGLEPLVNEQPVSLSITIAVMLFFYQLIFTSLAIAFGLVGFHKGVKLNVTE
jgi:hypothetical protein